MGEFLRSMDWSETPVGDPSTWPQSLRTSVSICINSPTPLLIWWGRDLVKIYNEEYRELIAARHPKAMSANGADIWPEILPNVLPILKGILKDGEAKGSEDQMLVIERNGEPEVCYFSFSFSAIRDEAENVGGVFCTLTETTKRVVAEKKLSTLLNNLFIQAPVAICILRGENYIVEVANRGMLELWGRSESDILNRPIFEAIPEAKEQGFKELLDTVYTKGERFVTEEHPVNIIRHGKMENAFAKFIYEPLREEDGSVSGIMAVAHEVTEEISARNRMQEINQRYHRMLMDSPFAFTVMKGKEMVITLANDLMKDFWGKGDDVEGKTLLELLPELEGQPFPGIIDDVYTTGIPFASDEILVELNRNGKMEDHYFNVAYRPHYEADQTISGVIAVVYEVTEMAIGRKKLETQANMVSELFMTAPGFVCTMTGPDHVFELINEKYQLFFGNRLLKGKPIMVALPELEGQGFDRILDNVYNTGETYVGIDSPVMLARGENLPAELHYFNFSYQPMYDENNRIYSILMFGYEVTEQMMAKKQIEESEVHFRLMADLIPAKITNAGADGGVTWYNKAWMDFTGMSFEDFRDFGYYSILHPDELEEFKRRFNSAVEKGSDLEMEMRFLNTEGEYIWNMNRASPVKDENGNIKMWIGVTSEIQKMKEEEKLKDDFLAMASHELKTPVTTIKAYGQIAEMMLQESGDKETLAVVSRMGTQVNKLTTLIGELLDFTKIKEGKLAYKEGFFDFNDFVKGVLQDMRHTSVTHTISYTDSIIARVFGDQEKLSQVVANLISNAIKYSPDAEKIIVTTKIISEGVELCVQDFGIGIVEEEKDRVFDKFYRGSGKIHSTFPGMGIGLHICAEIIKRHGGKVWIKRSNNNGSVFCMWIPFDYRQETIALDD